ncbi:MAG: hypothetical protein HUJ72_08480 [Blautia sp.]|nr:hypothetical protein [Blautia sp.]
MGGSTGIERKSRINTVTSGILTPDVIALFQSVIFEKPFRDQPGYLGKNALE